MVEPAFAPPKMPTEAPSICLRQHLAVSLDTMNETQLKEYKTKLEKERTLILAEIKKEERPVDFGSDIDHGEEDSDKSEEEGNQLAVANDLKKRLDEIDVALAKIPTGKYGACEHCGKPIEGDVLDVDPESRLCKSCKSQN